MDKGKGKVVDINGAHGKQAAGAMASAGGGSSSESANSSAMRQGNGDIPSDGRLDVP